GESSTRYPNSHQASTARTTCSRAQKTKDEATREDTLPLRRDCANRASDKTKVIAQMYGWVTVASRFRTVALRRQASNDGGDLALERFQRISARIIQWEQRAMWLTRARRTGAIIRNAALSIE